MINLKLSKKIKIHLPKIQISKTEKLFSIKQMLVFVLVFGAIGVYILLHSFAVTPVVATLEAESMNPLTGSTVLSDSNASGGKTLKLTQNGNATATISLTSPATSLTITARGDQCSGSPSMSVSVVSATGTSTSIINNASVSSSAYANYSAAANLESGSYQLNITAGNLGTIFKGKSKNSCSRVLYLDIATFYGDTAPAPTVTLSASPTTITTGGASNLTWSSTNATSCTASTASGAWSGTKATSGSESVTPTAATTYTLGCTGAGGTANASATVTVSSVAPPPTSTTSDGCSTLVYWCGNFENGNFLQWDGYNGLPNGPTSTTALSGSYFGLIAPPTGGPSGSKYAFKAYLDSGASTSGQAGQRTLVYNFPALPATNNKSKGYEGSEAWYQTAFYFPADYQPAPGTSWNWFNEWHNWPDSVCCANIGMSVVTNTEADGVAGEKIAMRLLGGGSPSSPVPDGYNANASTSAGTHKEWYVGDPALKRSHWYKSVVHVKWTYQNTGLVEWWLDDKLILSKQTSTLFYFADNNPNDSSVTAGPGQAYFMVGNYRPDGITTPSYIIHDGIKIGPTQDSLN